MLVTRRTFIVKKGHRDEAIGLRRELRQDIQVKQGGTMRVYASEVRPFDTVAIQPWHQAAPRPSARSRHTVRRAALHPYAEWFVRWTAATKLGGANEFWRLVEEYDQVPR